VAFSIFLCFFFRMRLRRFLIKDPMPGRRLAVRAGSPPSAAGSVAAMAPTLRAIDHVQLAMPEGGEERASAFYEGLLGLTARQKPAALAGRGGCWFSNGLVELHLGVESDFRAARKAHPALVVDGLEDLAGSLDAAGHPVRFDDRVPGVRRCYVDDPFGNRIELVDGGEPASGGRAVHLP